MVSNSELHFITYKKQLFNIWTLTHFCVDQGPNFLGFLVPYLSYLILIKGLIKDWAKLSLRDI